jgi:hypothetical protein
MIQGKDLTYFQDSFEYLDNEGGEPISLTEQVVLLMTYWTNATAANENDGGGGEVQPIYLLGDQENPGNVTLIFTGLEDGIIDEDTLVGSIKVDDVAVAEENLSIHYLEDAGGYYVIDINGLAQLIESTAFSWVGLLDTEGHQIYEEFANGIELGDWGQFDDNGGGGEGGGPPVGNNGQFPIYWFWYFLSIGGGLDRPPDGGDYSKQYVIPIMMVKKLLRK